MQAKFLSRIFRFFCQYVEQSKPKGGLFVIYLFENQTNDLFATDTCQKDCSRGYFSYKEKERGVKSCRFAFLGVQNFVF